jgi:hypothetical protein
MLCDTWATLDSLKQNLQQRFDGINLIYQPTKVSFRVGTVTFTAESVYSNVGTAGDADPNGTTANDFQRIRQLRQLASLTPTRLHLFLLENLGGGFSAIPPAFRCAGGSNVNKGCGSSSDCPGSTCAASPIDHYGIFNNVFGEDTQLAHELGHHFCNSHTHTWSDSASASGGACTLNPGLHDGDGLPDADTPEDPSHAEVIYPAPGGSCPSSLSSTGDNDLCLPGGDNFHPNYAAASYAACHEWCDWLPVPGLVDPGSPRNSRCIPACFQRSGGANQTAPFAPKTELVMSYYKHECSGPYVINGKRTEAFSAGQIQRVLDCVANIAERSSLTDVCGAGSDTDHDGICDAQDRCPKVADGANKDDDGDGLGNACDKCPSHGDPANLDTDGDGKGDVCDPDDDNDGCTDAVDQHPLESKVPIGLTQYFGCPQEFETRYGFEGENSDGEPDGANCADWDDDDDGIADALDECPIDADQFCILPGIACPPLPDPWANLCIGPGCVELGFKLELVSPVNPALFVFDEFQIRDGTIFVPALAGMTISETLDSLAGGFLSAPPAIAGAAAAAAEPFNCGRTDCLALQIRDPDGKVIPVDSYRPEDVRQSGGLMGRLIAIHPAAGVLDVHPTWGADLPLGATLGDADGDGVPDVSDACVERPDPLQRDFDRDGFGDACDLDTSQCGIVTVSEAYRVSDCVGVDFANPARAIGDGDLPIPLELERLAQQERCAGTDLDASGLIDDADVTLAMTALGGPPGPSGFAVPPNPCEEIDPRDLDSDFIPNESDNCPFFSSRDLADADGDGRGNACECTDQNGDGRNDVRDLIAINVAIFNPGLATPLCDGNNDGRCNVQDIIAANVEIYSPTSTSTCARQPVPGP